MQARGQSSCKVRLQHLPPELRIPLRFEPRGDHATQLRVVEWALWKTGDLVGARAANRGRPEQGGGHSGELIAAKCKRCVGGAFGEDY